MNVLDVTRLRSIIGVALLDRVKIEEVARIVEMEWELASRVGPRVLRWFYDVERINEVQMAKRLIRLTLSGELLRA